MQDQLLNQEDNVEDLRKVFLEADVDYSGYLSVNELWAALKKKGADISLEDVCELMAEIDIDRDGQLDIDEFISLMSLGDQLPLTGKVAKSTYQKM
jgi:Ca2+-binding EF-hand superfamily protein